MTVQYFISAMKFSDPSKDSLVRNLCLILLLQSGVLTIKLILILSPNYKQNWFYLCVNICFFVQVVYED